MHAVSPLPLKSSPAGFARARAQGFTLIEVMIAVAIVALLASVAMPAYQSWRTRALSRQTAQELAMMSAIIDQYAVDNGGAYPESLAAVGLGSKKDPWGNVYEFTNLTASGANSRRRQDKNVNPINDDYDLFSPGPNAVWKKQLDNADSVEDIVRGRSGRFFGLASDF